MKKIGIFNCRYNRNGLIQVEFNNLFTAFDKIIVNRFFTEFARRNRYKLPLAIEFV